MGKFKESKLWFHRALQDENLTLRDRVISLKEYAKVLIKQGNSPEADEKIQEAIRLADNLDGEDNDLRAKLLILLSHVHNTPVFAEEVVKTSGINRQLRNAACKFLIYFYSEQQDSIQVLSYIRMMKELHADSIL